MAPSAFGFSPLEFSSGKPSFPWSNPRYSGKVWELTYCIAVGYVFFMTFSRLNKLCLFFLGACWAWSAEATIEFVNLSRLQTVEAVKAHTFDLLYNGNENFRGMIRELDENSDQVYKMVFVDTDLHPQFRGGAKPGFHFNGAFYVSSNANVQHSPDQIAQNPALAKENAINDLRFMSNVILLFMRDIPVGDKTFYSVQEGTMLQETFHALQHEYHCDHGQPDYFLKLNEHLPIIEVEGELANYLFRKPNRDDILRVQMAKIKGFQQMVTYFKGLALGYEASEKERTQFNQTLMDVWTFMVNHMGYPKVTSNQSKSNLTLTNLKTLHWFMKTKKYNN
jgi:hypothetical protein